jgi:hypothetical protein
MKVRLTYFPWRTATANVSRQVMRSLLQYIHLVAHQLSALLRRTTPAQRAQMHDTFVNVKSFAAMRVMQSWNSAKLYSTCCFRSQKTLTLINTSTEHNNVVAVFYVAM